MLHEYRLRLAVGTVLSILICGLSACTSPREYFRNGFKVGPSYGPPAAPLPHHWIDANDTKLHQQACADVSRWWGVFNDPLLNQLIANAYRQNLTLRQAGYRVLQARALCAITVGNIFPQAQFASGSYTHFASGNTIFDNWSTDFNLSWELDFWGRFRRAVAAADDNLDASVADYDQVIVTLLGDVAQNYVRVRTDQQRIKYLIKNVKLQKDVFDYVTKQNLVGFQVSDLEYYQQKSNLYQTKSAIPQLQIDMRQAENQLCVLLGMPVADLDKILGINMVNLSDDELAKITVEELDEKLDLMLGKNPIPKVPAEIVVNLPADLLRQRPDVRAAERRAASQGEQIGIAEADLYPIFSINGSLGYSAANLPDLFKPQSFNRSVGPSFQWNVLNYGRILNNVRFQDCAIPGIGGVLSANGARGRPGSGGRNRYFLEVARERERHSRECGGRRLGRRKSQKTVRDRRRHLSKLDHLRGHSTEFGVAAGLLCPGSRTNRPRLDPGLSGIRGRLGDALCRTGGGAVSAICPAGWTKSGTANSRTSSTAQSEYDSGSGGKSQRAQPTIKISYLLLYAWPLALRLGAFCLTRFFFRQRNKSTSPRFNSIRGKGNQVFGTRFPKTWLPLAVEIWFMYINYIG